MLDAARDAAVARSTCANMLTLQRGGRDRSCFSRPASTTAPRRSTTSSTSSSRARLDQLGLEQRADRDAGASSERSRVRHARRRTASRAMFDRIAPVYDAMNRVDDRRARPALAPAHGRRRSSGPATACSTPCCGTGDLAIAARRAGAARHRARLLGADARARAAQGAELEWIQGDLLALPFEDATLRRGDRRLRRPQRRRPRARRCVELRRVLRPGGRLGDPRDHAPRGPLAPFYRLWFDRIVPLLGKLLPGGDGLHVPARERAPLPGPEELAGADRGGRLREVRVPALRAAASSRCTRRDAR